LLVEIPIGSGQQAERLKNHLPIHALSTAEVKLPKMKTGCFCGEFMLTSGFPMLRSGYPMLGADYFMLVAVLQMLDAKFDLENASRIFFIF
jgi:hypothetical protein